MTADKEDWTPKHGDILYSAFSGLISDACRRLWNEIVAIEPTAGGIMLASRPMDTSYANMHLVHFNPERHFRTKREAAMATLAAQRQSVVNVEKAEAFLLDLFANLEGELGDQA